MSAARPVDSAGTAAPERTGSAADSAPPPLLALQAVSHHFGQGPAPGWLDRRLQRAGWQTPSAVTQALDGVDLAVHPREVVGLVGESGCGKSTLGRIAAQLLAPSAGQVLFNGRPTASLDADQRLQARLAVQMVFQDPQASLNPRLRVAQAVGEAARVHGLVDAAALDDHVCAQLARTGLNPALRHRYPHQFSGGQRQRVVIARALAVHPALLVCDEAVAALDVSIQAQILNLFMDLRAQLGLALLFISHDLGVVEHLCDRVVVMYLGRVVESAPVDALFAGARHPYTQALLAEVPRIATRRTRFRPLQGEVPSPLSPPSGCHFHPRCPRATALCRQAVPTLTGTATGHAVACHHPDSP